MNCTGKFRQFQNTEAANGGFSKNFTKFTGKHLCQNSFLIKLQASGPQLIKKETPTQVFFCKLYVFFRTPFLQATVSQNMKAYI